MLLKMRNVFHCTWSVLTYSMMSELRGKGDSQYTVRYWEYVWILRRVASQGKMWARWSRGGGWCSTLHQQGCSLTGPHDHFLIVPAFLEKFAHYFSNSLHQIFVMFWVVTFIKMSWLNRWEKIINAQFRFWYPQVSCKAARGRTYLE